MDMLMKEKYKVGEIEKLFGFPRSTLRHYIDKQLLTVMADESNGYRYFDTSALFDLFDIAYRRNALRFNLSDIRDCIHASTMKEYASIFESQKKLIQESIEHEKACLGAIELFIGIIDRVRRYCGKIMVIYAQEMHFFPLNFNIHSSIFPASYPSAEFVSQNGTLICNRLLTIVFADDVYLLSEEDVHKRESISASGQYVYSIICSKKDVLDPSLLGPVLTWAQSHQITVREPYYVCYLFNLAQKDNSNYYEVYLPLDMPTKVP